MGPDGMESPDAAVFGGEGIVGVLYTTIAAPTWAYTETEKFVMDYEERFGLSPEPFAAQGYDASGVCLDGIERAFEANGGILPSRSQVSAAVRQTEEYAGITGPITFNSRGDRDGAAYFVWEVQSSDPNLWYRNELVETLWLSIVE